jgi:arginine decarboxylase
LVPLPKLKAGAMVNCVLANNFSDKKGDKISAAIAIAIGDNLGCVAESSGINKSPNNVKNEAEAMAKYMMEKRNENINELVIEEINHVVEEIATVVVSLVYLDDKLSL